MNECANKKNSILFNLLLITIFFNIWFPKAGIKLSGIPLTVGNILFALTFILWLLNCIRKRKIKKPLLSGIVMLGIFYFFLRYMYILLLKNIEFSSIIGYLIPLCIYPLIYFVAYDLIDSKEKIDKILKIIIYGFFFLCFYAILQYVFKIENVAIPGLTVNLSDYQELGPLWYMAKSNGMDRSSVKIVGTYQNGNLFGISLILIYPIIYNFYKKNKQKFKLYMSLFCFIVATFLTLSRSCWLGIILFIFLGVFMERDKTKQGLSNKILIIFICVIFIFFVFTYLPSVANRFFGTTDWTSMSGRTEGLIEVFRTIGQLSSILPYITGPYGLFEYSGLAYEMLPLAVFVQSGIIGVLLLYKFFLLTVIKLKNNNFISKAIKLSLIIWLIVGLIECGYWLPPAALNIYFLIALGLKSNLIYVDEKNFETCIYNS